MGHLVNWLLEPDFSEEGLAKNQTVLKAQHEKGLFFWTQGMPDGTDVHLSSHVTPRTPHWCHKCMWASDRESCFIHGSHDL